MKLVEAGIIRCINGCERYFYPNGFHFLREDVVGITNAFAKSAIAAQLYLKSDELITLHHGLKNFLGRDLGFPAVINAVMEGNSLRLGTQIIFEESQDICFD